MTFNLKNEQTQFIQQKESSSIQFYENVELMFNDTNLKKGDIVQTTGYYLPGDGGATIYRIVSHKRICQWMEEATGKKDGNQWFDLSKINIEGLFQN